VLAKVMDDELVPFAVIDSHTERAVGLVSYMAIERLMGSVEIGHVTWSRKMKARIGTEAVWLLLKNAFEHGYRRLVEVRFDERGIAQRRRASGLCLGRAATTEAGAQGRNRDSDMLSIIDSEWPA
jgi:hypothetical protein